MRAEVGLLTRNILIQGEMEDVCYGDLCEWFDVDTFGGQTQVDVNTNTTEHSYQSLFSNYIN